YEPDIKKSASIKMNVEMALVNVTVTDPYSRLVTGLDKENFRLYEDGIEQEISAFASEDVPISIGLIFDMSGSMADKVEKARQAAIQFMRTANPRDEFFLVSFNDRAELTSRFTSSIEELENRMMFTMAKGRTALLDAIYLGLSQMRSAHNGKRALLIISDGGDNHSRYNQAMRATMAPGGKSKLSCSRPKGFRPSMFTPKLDITRQLNRPAAFASLFGAALLIIASPLLLRAQRPSQPAAPQAPSQGPDYSIRKDVNLVLLHVSVVNDRGQFVSGLKQNDFRVMEDKVDQKISVFSQEDVPVSMGL